MAEFVIKSGDSGKIAKVNDKNQLEANTVSRDIQHATSQDDGQAFQVIGVANLASGTVTGLHVKNTSQTKEMVVTFVRHQIIDNNSTLPDSGEYFSLAFGRTLSSGGSTASVIAVNQSKNQSADVTATQGAPTLTGTAMEIDRWYTKAEGDMNIFDKKGSIILGVGKTMELSYVGTSTTGILYTRLSFLMQDPTS